MNTSEEGYLGYTNLFCLLIYLVFLPGCKSINFNGYEHKKIYNEQATDLKLNGYYFYESENLFFPTFLYADGSCLSLGGFPSEEALTEYLKSSLTANELINYWGVDVGWGGYYINNNKIVIQYMVSLSSGGVPVTIGVLEQKGSVLSDTSFIIQQVNRPQQNRTMSVEILYRYNYYPNKPDSTNWVKQEFFEEE